jgi:hypothetical protein
VQDTSRKTTTIHRKRMLEDTITLHLWDDMSHEMARDFHPGSAAVVLFCPARAVHHVPGRMR